MQPHEELELKTLLSAEDFSRLIALYPDSVFIPQHNLYFESRNSSHYAFRIRSSQGHKLFTLKHKVDGHTMEYEKEFSGDFRDDPEIMAMLATFNEYPPFNVMGELLTLRSMHVTSAAELCLDINFYNGITDYEVEYEVRAEHDHETAFRQILAAAGIEYVPNKLSKYKRCLQTLR